MGIGLTVAAVVAGASALAVGAARSSTPAQSSAPTTRRTEEDYYGTSLSYVKPNSLAPINPISPIGYTNGMNPIQQINPIDQMQPIQPINPYKVPGYINQIPDNPTMNYYTDPYQVNSLLDVFTNKAAGELVLKDYGLDDESMPKWYQALNKTLGPYDPLSLVKSVVIGVDYIKRAYVDPISEGDFGKAGMNFLIASGENMDVLANPVKGLLMEGPEGFMKATGFTDAGRVNYDFNVKSGINIPDNVWIVGGADVVDIALEALVDPLNWISFGSSSAVKNTAKTAGSMASDGVKAAGDAIVKAGLNSVDDIAESAAKTVSAQMASYALKGKATDFTDLITKLKFAGVADDVASGIIDNATNILKQGTLGNVYQGAGAIYRASTALDKAIQMTGPLGVLSIAGKTVLPAANTARNWAVRHNFVKLDKLKLNTPEGKVLPLDSVMSEDGAFAKAFKDIDDAVVAKEVTGRVRSIEGMPDTNRLRSLYSKFADLKGPGLLPEFLDYLANTKNLTPELHDLIKNTPDMLRTVQELFDDVITPAYSMRSKVVDSTIADLQKYKKSLYKAASKGSTRLDAVQILIEKMQVLKKGDVALAVEEVYDKFAELNSIVKHPEAPEFLKAQHEVLQHYIAMFNDVSTIVGFNIRALGDMKYVSVIKEAATYTEKINLIDKFLASEQTKYTFLQDEIADIGSEIREYLWHVRNGIHVEAHLENMKKQLRIIKWEEKGLKKDLVKVGEDMTQLRFIKKLLVEDGLELKPVKPTAVSKTSNSIRKRIINNSDLFETHTRGLYDHVDMQPVTDFLLSVKNSATEFPIISDLLNDVEYGITKLQLPDRVLLDGTDVILSGVQELNASIDAIRRVDTLIKKGKGTTRSYKKALKDARTALENYKVANAGFINEGAHREFTEYIEALTVRLQDAEGVFKAVKDSADAPKDALRLMDIPEFDFDKAYAQGSVHTAGTEVRLYETYRYNSLLADLQESLPYFVEGQLDNVMGVVELLKELSESIDKIRRANPAAFNTRAINVEALDQLQEFADILNTEANRASLKVMDIKTSTAFYTLQQNRLITLIDILDSLNETPEVRAFVDACVDDNSTDPIYAMLKNLAEFSRDTDVSLLAEQGYAIDVLNTGRAQYNFERFLGEIDTLAVGDNKDIVDALLDWMAGKQDKSVADVINLLYEGDEISVDKLHEHLSFLINSYTFSGVNKNTALHEILNLGKVNVDKAHTALYDADITAKNRVKLAQEMGTPLAEGHQFVSYDIETSGLHSKKGHTVTQIGAALYEVRDGAPVKLNEFHHGANLREGIELTEKLKTLTALDSEIPIHTTQGELLTAFKQWLPADVEIVGHNNKAFDNKFLNDIDTSPFPIDFSGSVDVLDIAQKYSGMRVISKEAVSEMLPIIDSFIKQQQALYPSVLIKLFDGDAMNRLFDIARYYIDGYFPGIKVADSDAAIIMKDTIERIIGRDMYAMKSTAEGLKPVRSTSWVRSLREELQSIKRNNAAYKARYIDMDLVRKDYGDINIASLLNGRTATGEIINKFHISNLAPKALVKDYSGGLIKFADNNKIDMSKLTIITRRIKDKLEVDKLNIRELKPEYKTELLSKLEYAHRNNPVWELVDNPAGRTTGELWALHSAFTDSGLNVDKSINLDNFFLMKKQDSILLDAKLAKDVSDAYATIMSVDASPLDLMQSQETLRRFGKNQDQYQSAAACYRYINDDLKDPGSITDRVRTVTALAKNEANSYQASNIRLAKAVSEFPDPKALSGIAAEIASAETKAIFDTPAPLLANMMEDMQAPILHAHVADDLSYRGLFDNLAAQKDYFDARGVDVYYKDGHFALVRRLDYVYDNTLEKVNKAVEFSSDIGEVSELLSAHKEAFDKVNNLRRSKFVTGPANTAVTPVDKAAYDRLFDRLPDGLKVNSALNDKDFAEQFFKTKDPIYSYHNLGESFNRSSLDQFYTDSFRNTMTGLEAQIKRSAGKEKLMQLYFNNDIDINSRLWKDLSDQQILDAMKENNYLVGIVLGERKGRPDVTPMRPQNLKDIAFLREMDAVLVPEDMANSVMATINVSDFADVLNRGPEFSLEYVAAFWHRYVVGTYKTLYVSSPGLVIRNFEDIIVKNMVDGTIDEIPADMKAFFVAMKDWNKYEEIMDGIAKQYDGFTTESIDKYLTAHNIDRDWFNELRDYETSNITAGMTQAQEDMIKSFAKGKDNRSGAAKLYDTLMYEKNLYTRKLMDINTRVEHAGRLSKYRIEMARGANQFEAYHSVLRTHFDYRSKTQAMLNLETMFPFVLFPLKNLQFWMTQVAESPWIARTLIDASVKSMNIEQQKQFTLDNSMKLQSAMTNGNIIIGNTIFKASPSMYDAMNLLIDPASEFDQRLIAPIKLGVNALKGAVFGEDEDEYVSTYVTNLQKIGVPKELEERLNDLGLYTVTRAANAILKGVGSLIGGDLEPIDNVADVLPSVFTQYTPNYGAKIGENFQRNKYKATDGTMYVTSKTTDGSITNMKYYPKERYPKKTYVPRVTSGRSYNRIPYAKRYYTPSSNIYNKWKINRVKPYAAPASAESLQYAFKDFLYQMNMNPRVLKMYNRKQRAAYKR